jgi:L-fuculose-phosphate aldolase
MKIMSPRAGKIGRAPGSLKERRACLLAHHGVIALGKNMDEAVALAGEVERLAEQ